MTISSLALKIATLIFISLSVSAAAEPRMASPADSTRIFEMAEKIAKAMELDAASFFDGWPAVDIAQPKRANGMKQISVDGGRFNIGSRIRAEGSQIMLSAGGTEIARVTLELNGDCVSREAVKERYPKYFVAHVPHGQSLDEVLTYATKLGDTQVEFAFPEKNRKCMSGVILTRQSPPRAP